MTNRLFRWFTIIAALAVLAAACGGEVGDTAEVDETTTTTAAPIDDGAEDTPPDEVEDPPTPDGPNFFDDPRGGIFSEFQLTFDRGSHPFQQVDAYCLPHDAAENRVGSSDGITADSIAVGHIRTRLEDADAFGFFVPVGDPKDMFEVFINYINEECGGIRGRQLDLGYAEAALIVDVDTSRNAACLAVTEDHHSVIVMNSTGFQGSANLCLVDTHETAFISTQGQIEEFMAAGQDRLISISPTLEESLEFMVQDLLASGAFDGHSLGVAAPNTPGQAEAVEAALVEPLRAAGFSVEFDVIDCGGGSICGGGILESVTNMVNANVDVFFNVLNILSAPGYITEMANQGYEPGDVQFYASDFNSQAAELVSGQIPNNVIAGNLYNGAIIIDFRDTGSYRAADYVPTVLGEMCNDVYGANTTTGANYEWESQGGDSAWGMTGSVCSIVRIMARALYDAGDNPTEADVHAALANLGPIDDIAMVPSSIRPGKTQAPDAIQTIDFTFPCDQPFAYDRGDNGEPVCLTGRGDWRPAPR